MALRSDWIQTLEGRALYQRALRPEAVGSIGEIAHALAGNFRFTRQTAKRYSVAEHCEKGSRLLPACFAGAFLLHELSEVYLPDISGPMKPFVFVEVAEEDQPLFAEWWHFDEDENPTSRFVSWTVLEKQHTRVMLDVLKLRSLEPLIYAPEIKAMDRAMLAAEKRDLCTAPPEPWAEDRDGVEPAKVDLTYPHAPDQACAAWLQRFAELFR